MFSSGFYIHCSSKSWPKTWCISPSSSGVWYGLHGCQGVSGFLCGTCPGWWSERDKPRQSVVAERFEASQCSKPPVQGPAHRHPGIHNCSSRTTTCCAQSNLTPTARLPRPIKQSIRTSRPTVLITSGCNTHCLLLQNRLFNLKHSCLYEILASWSSNTLFMIGDDPAWTCFWPMKADEGDAGLGCFVQGGFHYWLMWLIISVHSASLHPQWAWIDRVSFQLPPWPVRHLDVYTLLSN